MVQPPREATSKKGLRASKISYSPFGITMSFQFADHRQEMHHARTAVTLRSLRTTGAT